ncbi:hypothetical protein HJC23_007828 [Cyclotella cryptica]|uniref:Wax synthase domain-containing protein n=1 Tax=Cyclotella cryptica TaxID=29204 RepID=A0ABD3R0U7_9STRA
MAAAPSTCLDEVSAGEGHVELLTSPFEDTFGCGRDSCSFPSAVDRLQNTMSPLDLSLDFSKVGFIGRWLDSHAVGGKCEVVFPDIRTITSLTMGISLSISFGVLFSILLYYLVVPGEKLSKRKVVSGSFLLTVTGFIPYILFDLLTVKNTAVRFTICTPFVLYGFKILEAIFGFVPVGAKSSLQMYCQYFSFPSEILFDSDTSKPILASKKDVLDSAKHVMFCVLRVCLLCSCLSHHNYKPFGDTNAGEFFDGIGVGKHFNARHLGNCFTIALFFQQALALGDAVMGNTVQIITGYKVLKSMRNPMLAAKSPSDFWGRRWNIIVHSVMKRGVYKAVRKYSSPILASLLVFIASGLFHEWLVHAMLIYGRSVSSGSVFLGSNTAFFIWNFVVIMVERLLVRMKVVKSIGKTLPRPLSTLVIIMSSLPVAHWFGNPYLNGGFFQDYEQCIIIIRKR